MAAEELDVTLARIRIKTADTAETADKRVRRVMRGVSSLGEILSANLLHHM